MRNSLSRSCLLIEDDYRRLRSFGGKSSLKTWLFAVVKHHVDRQLVTRGTFSSLEEVPGRFLLHPSDQEETLSSEGKRELVEAAITQLTDRERELFDLLVVRGLSGAEAAKLLGIKADSVRRRKYALVKKLQRLTIGG